MNSFKKHFNSYLKYTFAFGFVVFLSPLSFSQQIMCLEDKVLFKDSAFTQAFLVIASKETMRPLQETTVSLKVQYKKNIGYIDKTRCKKIVLNSNVNNDQNLNEIKNQNENSQPKQSIQRKKRKKKKKRKYAVSFKYDPGLTTKAETYTLFKSSALTGKSLGLAFSTEFSLSRYLKIDTSILYKQEVQNGEIYDLVDQKIDSIESESSFLGMGAELRYYDKKETLFYGLGFEATSLLDGKVTYGDENTVTKINSKTNFDAILLIGSNIKIKRKNSVGIEFHTNFLLNRSPTTHSYGFTLRYNHKF